MWPFGKKKPRQRRVDARKSAPTHRQALWRRFQEHGGISALLIAAGFYLAVAAMDLWPLNPLPYRAGQYVGRDITARVDFRVLDPYKRRRLEQERRESTPATFRLNEQFVDETVAALAGVPEDLAATTRPVDLEGTPQRELASSEAELEAWHRLGEPERREAFERMLADLRERLARAVVVAPEAATEQNQRKATRVRLVSDAARSEASVADLITVNQPRRLRAEAEEIVAPLPRDLRASAAALLMRRFADGGVTYRPDPGATQEDIRGAVESLTPEQYSTAYRSGQPIVLSTDHRNAGRPTGLTDDDLQLLRAEHQAYLRELRLEQPWRLWLQAAGRAVVLLFATALLCLYIVRYQPQIARNPLRGLSVVGLMLTMLVVAKLLGDVLAVDPHSVVLSVLMGSMLMAVAFDQRFAVAVGAALAFFAVLQLRGDLGLLMVLLGATAGGVWPLAEVRTRTKLIEVSAVAALVGGTIVWALAAAWRVPWPFALEDSLWTAGFALLAGFLAQGILPLIERVFHICTSMTLLEWCDASKPLLRRLATEAPGTYNHSLQLGSMCEAAADAIGARGLLARVGAYYHDIGKTSKSGYFIENEPGSSNRHAKLSPAMSLLIIVGHVKDGLELAREYGLPRVLHEFIAAHHGTTLVQCFFHAATERRKETAEPAPEESDFRYPGPKPRSKEVAILMLADAVESSLRAMPDPTPGRIENQVHTMVNRRLMDGQLDECDLTLKEVHRIENSLIKSLNSIYHGRIAYPTPPGEKPSAAEQKPEDRPSAEADNTSEPQPAGAQARRE